MISLKSYKSTSMLISFRDYFFNNYRANFTKQPVNKSFATMAVRNSREYLATTWNGVCFHSDIIVSIVFDVYNLFIGHDHTLDCQDGRYSPEHTLYTS